ncbi:MAG: fatty acid desaturase [Methylococcales bacterium]
MKNAPAEPLRVRIFSSYLLSLLIPGYSLLFILSGPHSIAAAIFWIVPMWATVLIDMWSPPSRKQPDQKLHPLPYDVILYLLAAVQFLAILALLNFSTRMSFGSFMECAESLVNLFAIKVIVGTSSSFSGIVVAHELIHRPGRCNQSLGRLLLALVCYEHFATEHLRGHHKKFASASDPATASFGQSYQDFWNRTVVAQFKNAWRLENERLGIQARPGFDGRLFRHRVAQGLVLEIVLLSAIVLRFGLAGLVVFGVQAFAAVRKLEAVNYIEHWGLSRELDRSGSLLSWDTDSWFTLNAIVGLSRHSDHHRSAQKPYHQLCFALESPKLPYGYFATVFFAVCLNDRYQALVRRELDKVRRGWIDQIQPGGASAGRVSTPFELASIGQD